MTDDYKPRFSFEITEEQMLRANKLLSQYGLRKAIFGRVLDDVLDAIEVDAGMATGLLMSEKVVMKGIMTALADRTSVKKGKDNG
ncbi:MAG: hypothetical protein BWY21_01483 [Parcubacteria group bacterium ADurb.Bin216]|jgi:hypothetical protein|nr:MAG: hypothetical protein BWY21_01483 [Parcubacteria group bacterium ADurb.Bin216]